MKLPDDGNPAWMKVLGVVLFAALSATVLVSAFIDQGRTEQPKNGDMLGPALQESPQDYEDRAAESLARAPENEDVFALVSFDEALTSDAAGLVVADIGRVNALIAPGTPMEALPEPIAGEDRGDVFARGLKRADEQVRSRLGSGVPAVAEGASDDETDLIEGVIVYDTGDRLRELAGQSHVRAIEALPPDAVWTFFGVTSTPPAVS